MAPHSTEGNTLEDMLLQEHCAGEGFLTAMSLPKQGAMPSKQSTERFHDLVPLDFCPAALR